MKSFRHCSTLFLVLLISTVLCAGQQRSRFAAAIPDWKVGRARSVSLLLAFDTDPSLNRMSYNKLYDCDVNKFFPQSQCRYRTVMWTRAGDSVALTVNLPIVASPTSQGFFYAGFAGYSELPRPTEPEWWCDKDCPPSFVDCGDIWQTTDPTLVGEAIARLKRQLATGRCGKAAKDNANITLDWRISFITPKVLAKEGLRLKSLAAPRISLRPNMITSTLWIPNRGSG